MEYEEEKPKQFALTALSFDDRMVLAKSLKRAVESTSSIEEKRYYKTRIRELFTDEEWDKLIQEKNQKGEPLNGRN